MCEFLSELAACGGGGREKFLGIPQTPPGASCPWTPIRENRLVRNCLDAKPIFELHAFYLL
jgi:hypothetical protein